MRAKRRILQNVQNGQIRKLQLARNGLGAGRPLDLKQRAKILKVSRSPDVLNQGMRAKILPLVGYDLSGEYLKLTPTCSIEDHNPHGVPLNCQRHHQTARMLIQSRCDVGDISTRASRDGEVSGNSPEAASFSFQRSKAFYRSSK